MLSHPPSLCDSYVVQQSKQDARVPQSNDRPMSSVGVYLGTIKRKSLQIPA
jgi:hypothetical protein